jgi:tetratricopeptide (TPR) repeat protein
MNTFWNWWNSLTPGMREGIVIGLITTVAGGLVLSIFTGFWKLVGKSILGTLKLIQRLLNWAWPPDSTEKPTLQAAKTEPASAPSLAAAPAAPEKVSEPQDATQHETASLIPRPPVVGFVSRRDEQGRDIVERLKEELAPGNNRLVTLSGAGGLGKTTLAAEAARQLLAAYDGRITWSSADGRPEFSLLTLLDDIATQLGHAELRTLAPAVKEEQVRALVAAPPTLITLDNCETISEEEHRRIETWFARAQCSALFTSRQGVAGTAFVRVSAMSSKEAAEFLEKLTGQTREPHLFTPDVRERVYETAEANPYVMQWVVAQIDDAKEPATVLKELAEGESDAAERVFARSFNLPQLGDDGRDALLALSLFAPSASREALAAVAGLGENQRGLNEAVKHLHALWLVKGVDGNSRLTVDGLTRTLATARLSKDPRADEFRRRLIAYFLSYAAERRDSTPENHDALEAEKDNLLGAAEAAFASEEWRSVMLIAIVLARPASGMLSVRGYWDETVRLGEQALQAARSSKDDAKIADYSHNVAVMYENRGEPTKARQLHNESLEIEKRLGNQHGVALSLHQLGRIAQNEGDKEEARRLYSESLEIEKRLGNQDAVARTLHHLGILAERDGEVEEARRLYSESLEIEKKLSNQNGVAYSLGQLGVLEAAQGEYEEAQRLFNECLEILRGLGDQHGIALTLNHLGKLSELEGNNAKATQLFREALSIFEKLGSPIAELAQENLARVEGRSS